MCVLCVPFGVDVVVGLVERDEGCDSTAAGSGSKRGLQYYMKAETRWYENWFLGIVANSEVHMMYNITVAKGKDFGISLAALSIHSVDAVGLN